MSFSLRSGSVNNANHYNKWYKKYKSSNNQNKSLSSLNLLSSKIKNTSISKNNKTSNSKNSNEQTEIEDPNWTEIPSKSKGLSETEIQRKISDLAKKSCEASSADEKKKINSEVMKLKTEYVSQVSPDRKSLYNKTQKVIDNYNKTQKMMSSNSSSLSYLFKDTDITNKKIALSNEGYVTATDGVNGYNYKVTLKNNKEVMKTVNGEWSYTMTSEELEKQNEFFKKYSEAVDNIKKEMAASNVSEQELAKSLNTNLCIDYNISNSTDKNAQISAKQNYDVTI